MSLAAAAAVAAAAAAVAAAVVAGDFPLRFLEATAAVEEVAEVVAAAAAAAAAAVVAAAAAAAAVPNQLNRPHPRLLRETPFSKPQTTTPVLISRRCGVTKEW